MLYLGITGAVRCVRTTATALLFLTCTVPAAWGQNYQAGIAAVDAGDMARAVEIWQDVIDSNASDRPRAEYALALLYETGRAVPWDEARAAELYAASGLPEALTNLGLMHAEGRGVPFDPAKAAELWQQASDQGHSFASFNLGLAYYGGDGVPKNAVRALELIYEAGEGGLAEAQWAVCQFYERGVGVPADVDKAIEWCALAAEQGQLQAVDAVQRLSTLKREGDVPAAAAPSDGARSASANENSDNVDLTPQPQPQPEPQPESPISSTDPANEFVTEMPTEQASATDADSPAAPLIAETPTQTNEDRQAIDPLLLFGSEFEEFADLLAPVEEGADPSATVQSALEQSDLSLLSKDADEIAALIDSASVQSAELPELTIIEQPELADPQPGPEQPENAVVPLNLQELVDGTAAVAAAAAAGPPVLDVPPLPNNRPKLIYAIPPILDGPVYAVWLGTGENADEARALYDRVLTIAPDVLGIMQAAYQNDVLTREDTGSGKDQAVVRLLFGPLPGQDYAWQICNLLKLKQPSTFCYPVEVEG